MKFLVESILFIHQFCMCSGFNNPAFIQNHNKISMLYC